MSPGIDDYLAWRPGGLASAAEALEQQSEAMTVSAQALRAALDQGTHRQSGLFIDARRTEAEEQIGRIEGA